MSEIIKSFKGFNKDMTCRGFQYEVGKEYIEKEAVACKRGFHACEHPLDCFSYYAPSDSVFCEVEQSGEISKHDSDTKVASSKIKIGAKVNIAGLVKAAIEFTKSKIIQESAATGNYGASSATGYRGTSSSENPTAVAVAWATKVKQKALKVLILFVLNGNKMQISLGV